MGRRKTEIEVAGNREGKEKKLYKIENKLERWTKRGKKRIRLVKSQKGSNEK